MSTVPSIDIPVINITAYDALNQSVINVLINGFQMTPSGAYMSGVAGAGYAFVCKLVSPTSFQLFSADLTTFVTKSPGQDSYLFTNSGAPASFYFSSNLATRSTAPMDLTKTLWKDFIAGDLYIVDAVSIGVVLIYNLFGTILMVNTSPSGDTNWLKAKIIFSSPNQKMRTYLAWTNDPAIKAGCCMMAYENSDDDSKVYKAMCQQATLYSNNNSASPNLLCDAYMNQYCPTAPGAKYCGCYNTDAEIANLPLAMQAYGSVLKSSPTCWLSECSLNGYKNSALREPRTCSITICTQQTDISGDKNILTNSQGMQFCNGGVPIKVPTNPSTSTTGTTNSTTDSTTNSTGSSTSTNTSGSIINTNTNTGESSSSPPVTGSTTNTSGNSTTNNAPTGSNSITTPANNTGNGNVITNTNQNNTPNLSNSDSSSNSFTILGVEIPWYVFLFLIVMVIVLKKSDSPPQLMPMQMMPPNPYYMRYRG